MTDSDVAGPAAKADPTPNPHATAEQVEAALKDSKLAQVLYHDWEAETYDDKWSISYDKRCVDYARDLFDAMKLVGGRLSALPRRLPVAAAGAAIRRPARSAR